MFIAICHWRMDMKAYAMNDTTTITSVYVWRLWLCIDSNSSRQRPNENKIKMEMKR